MGEGPPRGHPRPAARDRARASPTRPTRSSRAGRGGSRARRARCRTAGRAAEFPEAKRLLGALANSRGHRHEENAAKLVNAALEQPMPRRRGPARVGRGLHAARERAHRRRARAARDRSQEVAAALAENLPAPKRSEQAAAGAGGRRRGKRRTARSPPRRGARSRRRGGATDGAAPKRRRRREPRRARAPAPDARATAGPTAAPPPA